MSTHTTVEIQIPYHIYMRLKPYVKDVTDVELDKYKEWCDDMAYLGHCPLIRYKMGTLPMGDIFGYLYTTKIAADFLFKFSK